MEKSEKDFGLCPVCKSGRIIKMNRDYVCTNRLKPVDTNSSCRFSLPLRSHGVDISDVMVRQLIQTGRTNYVSMHDQKGFPYQGCFEIEEGKGYTIRSEKRSINAICPDCGGNIIITRFGYACENSTVGIFEAGISPFTIGKRQLSVDDLRDADDLEIQKKYHEYATIMRQHNVSGRENAFDKLVNLFLAKIVDETQHADNLQFYWRGAAHDDYYNLQDRLQLMYSRGMKEFLGEEVTYIDYKTIADSFYLFKNDTDATKEKILDYFQQLKFYTNNDFSFLDVHNQILFRQNAEILKKVVP